MSSLIGLNQSFHAEQKRLSVLVCNMVNYQLHIKEDYNNLYFLSLNISQLLLNDMTAANPINRLNLLPLTLGMLSALLLSLVEEYSDRSFLNNFTSLSSIFR